MAWYLRSMSAAASALDCVANRRVMDLEEHSGIYEGWVRHRRYAPVQNRFRYHVFFMYLDLAELPEVLDPYWLWSARRPAPAWFRRRDYHGDAAVPLDEAVRATVAEHTGSRPRGPIRLLTHCRYFGYVFNPVSLYYCFDESGTTVETILAEITNTPWQQRRGVVLPPAMNIGDAPVLRYRFKKDFHVSPFMPMDIEYDWRFSMPGNTLSVHMENHQNQKKIFDATMRMEQVPIHSGSLARVLAQYPVLTIKVVAAIYFQAFRLWRKKIPFFTHPDKKEAPKPAR